MGRLDATNSVGDRWKLTSVQINAPNVRQEFQEIRNSSCYSDQLIILVNRESVVVIDWCDH